MGGLKWYPGQRQKLQDDFRKALEQTAEAVRTDLILSQTLPFANAQEVPTAGELQGSVYIDRAKADKMRVSVVTNTPYARRLYYHPEYRFYRGTNPNAGGMWYQPYINGRKRDFAKRAFERRFKAVRG